MRLDKAAKASSHAKFYSLSTGTGYIHNFGFKLLIFKGYARPEVRPWAKLFLALELNLVSQNLKRAIEYLTVLFLINSP